MLAEKDLIETVRCFDMYTGLLDSIEVYGDLACHNNDPVTYRIIVNSLNGALRVTDKENSWNPTTEIVVAGLQQFKFDQETVLHYMFANKSIDKEQLNQLEYLVLECGEDLYDHIDEATYDCAVQSAVEDSLMDVSFDWEEKIKQFYRGCHNG